MPGNEEVVWASGAGIESHSVAALNPMSMHAEVHTTMSTFLGETELFIKYSSSYDGFVRSPSVQFLSGIALIPCSMRRRSCVNQIHYLLTTYCMYASFPKIRKALPRGLFSVPSILCPLTSQSRYRVTYKEEKQGRWTTKWSILQP